MLPPQQYSVCSSKSSETVAHVLEIDFEWGKQTSVRSLMFSVKPLLHTEAGQG